MANAPACFAPCMPGRKIKPHGQKDTDRQSASKRGYDAKWRAFRIQVIADHIAEHGPVCACGCGGPLKLGEPKHKDNAEVDHITPHKGNQRLMWDRSNLQVLRKACHSRKTGEERIPESSYISARPEWLPKPAVPVTIICGPPGAGKTTYARNQAQSQDIVIDLDDCYEKVCGQHGHTASRKHIGRALRLRNSQLAALADKAGGAAYFIVCAPTKREREWWSVKLNAKVLLIDTELQTCLQRLPEARQYLAREWWQRHIEDTIRPSTLV